MTLILLLLQIPIGFLANIIANYLQQAFEEYPKFKRLSTTNKLVLFSATFLVFQIPAVFLSMLLSDYSVSTLDPAKEPVISDPLHSSPYRNAYINLLSADPDPIISLQASDDIPYHYKVSYYIPQFDWKRLGYEPHIQVRKIKGYTEYGSRETMVIKEVIAAVGQEATTNLIGRLIVPDDRDSWEIEISVTFVKIGTSRGTTSANHIIVLKYSISPTSTLESTPIVADPTPTVAPISSPPTSWKKSSIWTGGQSGPQDANGKYWMDRDFDDTSWLPQSLPDGGEAPEYSNQYYRAHFAWDGVSPLNIHFSSDDGVEIYVNSKLLGSWGNGWRQGGCINLSGCALSKEVPKQNVPADMLIKGDNVIAIDLSNGRFEKSNYYLAFSLDFTN